MGRRLTRWYLVLVSVPIALVILDAYDVPSLLEKYVPIGTKKLVRTLDPIVVTDQEILQRFEPGGARSPTSNRPLVKTAAKALQIPAESFARDWPGYYAQRNRNAPRLVCGGATPRQLADDLRTKFPDKSLAVLAKAQELSTGLFRPFGGQPLRLHEDFSWNAFPVRHDDVIFVWEIGTLQHLVLLAEAALLSGDESYVAAITNQLHEWVAENPIDNSIHWHTAMEVSLRLASLVCLEELLLGREEMPEVYPLLLKTAYGHARFLAEHIDHPRKHNNHGIFAPMGLFLFAATHPELPGTAAWKQFADDRLMEESRLQYTPAGVHKEFAPAYHKALLDAFLVYASAKRKGEGSLTEELQASLRAQAEFLKMVTGPDGKLGLIGDSDDHYFLRTGLAPQYETAPTLATAAALLDDGSLVPARGGRWEAAWLLGERRLPAAAETEPRSLRVYAHEGLFRIERAGTTLLGDLGPFGDEPRFSGHNHADIGNFLLWRGETPVVLDPGTYTYRSWERTHGVDWRRFLRTSQSHNTISVDGLSQSEPRGAFEHSSYPRTRLLFARESAGVAAVAGEHDAFGTTVGRAIRIFAMTDDQVLVIDWFPDARGSHTYETNVIFDRAARTTSDRYAITGGGFEWLREPDAVENLYIASRKPAAGWCSPRYGGLAPCPQFRGARSINGPAISAFRFRFFDAASRSPLRVTPIDGGHQVQSPGPSTLNVQLKRVDNARRDLHISVFVKAKEKPAIVYESATGAVAVEDH